MKTITKFDPELIMRAINRIAEPVIQTLTPLGNNVLFEKDFQPIITNDGATIAKLIDSEDTTEDIIIQMVKYGSLATNNIAGDGPQPFHSKIMTPSGCTTMGDIKVGDRILGTHGSIQEVEAIFDKGDKEVFELIFSDGRKVECSGEHIWVMSKDGYPPRTFTTEEILDDGIFREKTNGDRQFKYFDQQEAVHFSTKELPLDPYLVGVLIGDGSLSGADSTEISLGLNKQHIIDKLVLPDGLRMNVSYVENKNYFRINIIGSTKDGLTIRDLLTKISLQGTTSKTKFIPEEYLYSSLEQRTELFNGLRDTDGYINPRGFVEYSTVSEKLKNDVLHLMRSLGMSTCYWLNSNRGLAAYSQTPIHRISQTQGYKNGLKLVNIVRTGKVLPMRCIKVSNPDHLYFTDDFVLTHNTSTTILFIKELVDMGLKKIAEGVKPMALKSIYTDMKDSIISSAELLKNEISEEDWFNIALISSGGDSNVAENVVSIIDTAGLDGMVFLNESKNQKTKITKDSGYNLEQPMYDPILSNAGPGRADYNKPHVFITDKKLYHVEEAREILETAHKNGVKNLVIVARDFLGESSGFLISNHMDPEVPLNILMIKYPTPDNDLTPLYDLATYLDAKVVSEKIGNFIGKLNSDHYRLANRVYSAGAKTIFVTDNNTNPELTFLIEDVRRKRDEDKEDSKIAKRLACLTSGTVNLDVGAPTGPEARELIFRYEDAINATRSAIRSGYVVGGGLALYNATRSLDSMAKEFGEVSIRQIAKNCGVEFNSKEYGGDIGYNAKTGEFSDLRSDGIIEPFDVLKYSVINAVSITIAILTSGYFITNTREVKD